MIPLAITAGCSLLLVAIAAHRAPIGYQDETGFHTGTPPQQQPLENIPDRYPVHKKGW